MWDDMLGDSTQEPKTWTDTAQICMNGHLINASFKNSPELNKKHCSECGEPTLIECTECKSTIPGNIHYANVFGSSTYKVPSYCLECGKPYPWTLNRLKAAKELASELDELNPEEHIILAKSIEEIS